MTDVKTGQKSPLLVYLLVAATGFSSLSWEVLWQIKASLALGVSAWGTAVTLATMMGGMCLGSLAAGHLLKEKNIAHPLRFYGALEIVVGLSGLFLGLAFNAARDLDTWAYQQSTGSAVPVHILGIVVALGIPAICMGATLPLFGLAARQFRTSIAMLYGLNTLGAAFGCLLVAFVIVPWLGVTRTGWLISAINFAVGIATWLVSTPVVEPARRKESKISATHQYGPGAEAWIVFVTGFVTFMLEIAWFRSFTAAFASTTKAFAIMLASVLLALGAAATQVGFCKRIKLSLASILGCAGVGILLATPVVENIDRFTVYNAPPFMLAFDWLVMTTFIIGIPVFLLGLALPWILDDQDSSRRWGRLYALNTAAAIAGSISAAWLLLPTIGFGHTSWIAGVLVVVTGIALKGNRRAIWAGVATLALLVAVLGEGGVGSTRIIGPHAFMKHKPAKILGFYEGPDVTASVVEYLDGSRRLIIDGASASGQSGGEKVGDEHYMAWMAYLPMLLNPDAKNALVICFGTGQTANAVRRENPQSLDIVDINRHVFDLAPNFSRNEDVLHDSRVNHIVMDGRAYMRRTDKMYDVITLEPMPPTFAGVNALYSKEFYQYARARLAPHGTIAQWLPFESLFPYYSASIARTFADVFPNSILWIDPVSGTGILVGSMDDNGDLGTKWPGFARAGAKRNMADDAVRKEVWLNRKGVQVYGAQGRVITDDNQLLAYGTAVDANYPGPDLLKENIDFLKQLLKKNPDVGPARSDDCCKY